MSQQHSRKKSANIPRSSQRSSSRGKEVPTTTTPTQPYSILQKSSKKTKEGTKKKEKKDKSLFKSLYQTRSVERLHEGNKSDIDITARKDLQNEFKLDPNRKLAMKIAKIKKMVDTNPLSHRIIQSTEEIERTEQLIQREKNMLLSEFKTMNQNLKRLQEEGETAKTTRREYNNDADTTHEFRHSILNKIERLNDKYKDLEKSLSTFPKAPLDDSIMKLNKKRASEGQFPSNRKASAIVQTSREDLEHSRDQMMIHTERLRSSRKSPVKATTDLRKYSRDSTTNTQQSDKKRRKTEENEEIKHSKDELKSLKEALEMKEKEIKKREEKLDKRTAEFVQEKEDFEIYKIENEEKLKKEQKKVQEQKENLDKIEREHAERGRVLEQNKKDFERLTRELEDRSDDLMRRKEEHEREMEKFYQKVERFEKEKEEFTMFEKEFHDKNVDLRAEKERVRELGLAIAGESQELEQKYEEYYRKCAELEAEYQVIQRKEEEVLDKEKMLLEKMSRFEQLMESADKESDSNTLAEISETRLKQEEPEKRGNTTGKSSEKHSSKRKEKYFESFNADTSKEYSTGKSKDRDIKSSKKKSGKKNIENQAPEALASERLMAPENSWNDKSLMPLSSRVYNIGEL